MLDRQQYRPYMPWHSARVSANNTLLRGEGVCPREAWRNETGEKSE